MAQAFVTTYQFHFRGTRQDRVEPINPYKITEIQPEEDNDLWLVERGISADETDDSYLVEGAKLVKDMILKRMKTTYQVCYCKDETKDHHRKSHSEDVDEESMGNELLEYCKNLYGRKDMKLLPPLPSARRVYGYIRPSRLYTPITMYQHEIGRAGYNLLNR